MSTGIATKMDAQIQTSLLNINKNQEGIRGRFEFPDTFIGFSGHFPENPVLPGICKIKAALILLEHLYGRTVEIQEVVRAKFFAPVSANQPLIYFCREINADGDHRVVSVNITGSKAEKIAFLKLNIKLPKRDR